MRGLGHWAISSNTPVSAGPVSPSHIFPSDNGVCAHLTLQLHRADNRNTRTMISSVGHRVTSWPTVKLSVSMERH